MKNYVNEARMMADKMGVKPGIGWNDERDAFRHVYTSAVIASRPIMGRAQAYIGGELKEIVGDNTNAEHWMDRRNNKIGRDIGQMARENNWSKEEIAREIIRQINDGTVVTNPYDPRLTYEQHGDWERAIKESEQALAKDRMAARAQNQDNLIEQIDAEKRFAAWDKSRKETVKKQSDLLKKATSGGAVKVKSYTKDDGTKVKAHKRSWPVDE